MPPSSRAPRAPGLAPIAPLSALPAAAWSALGAHLRALGVAEEHAWAFERAPTTFAPAARPLRVWHLRTRDTPASRAVLGLAFGEPMDEATATEVMGPLGLSTALASGLLVTSDGRSLVCPLLLGCDDDLLHLSDPLDGGGDAVMGPGPWTASVMAAALPTPRVERALDLGCGGGILALQLAQNAAHVIATDVNPRATALARVNAALNGIENVETREGSLLEPVAGEAFDLVVSQPPFIPQPEGAPRATYMHGGHRGDELVLELLRALPARLADGGRAVLVLQSAKVQGSDPVDRITEALAPTGAQAVAFDAPGPDLDTYAIGDAAFTHPALDEAFARETLARRAHLDALDAEELRHVVLGVRRAPAGGRGWVRRIPLASRRAALSARDVTAQLALGALIDAGDDALLAARFRIPGGTAFSRAKDGSARAVPASDTWREVELDRSALQLLELVDGAPSLRAAASKLARTTKAPEARVRREVLAWVLGMTERGLLALAEG